MNITISMIATIAASIIVAPEAHADPNVCPPQASSCPAIDQQLLNDMAAVGIGQDPIHQSAGGLISGARNTVCPELEQGVPVRNIAAELQRYSGFTGVQATTYIADSIRFYCPNNAGMLP